MSKPKRKNRQYCFICGTLHGGDKENTQIHNFTVPKKKFDQWKQLVNGLEASSKLCHLHFDEKYIKKGKQILDKFYSFDKWTLTDDAIPHLFTGKKICSFKVYMCLFISPF
jgi:hypothetical protein